MAPDPRRSRPTPIPDPVAASVRRPTRFLLAAIALLLVGAGVTGGWALTEDHENALVAIHDRRHPWRHRGPTGVDGPHVHNPPPHYIAGPGGRARRRVAPTPDMVHGTLALPSIGVEQSLHEGVTLTAIDRGPSHWPGTAMPGEIGNVVVAGHRVTHSQPFHDLDRLRPGDPLVFTLTDGSRWTYELTGTEIVAPDAMHIVDQTPDPTATLFACHPKGSAAQRIVAHFRLVEH